MNVSHSRSALPNRRIPRVLALGAAGLRGGVGEYCRTIARSTEAEIHWILANDEDNRSILSPPTPFATAVNLEKLYGLASLPRAVASCRAVIRQERVDLVHAHTLRGGVLAALALRGSKLPLIYTPHSLRLAHKHPWWKYPYYWALEAIAHQRADAITFLSEYEARATHRAFLLSNPYYEVIPTTLDLEAFFNVGSVRATATLRGEPTIVMCGALDDRKDPLFFLDVAERTLRETPNARFIWIGDGPLREAVQNRITSAPLAGHVALLGAVPRSEVASIMGDADSMLFTSRAEGVPLAVPEAQAAGCVVVLREFPGFEEVLTSGTTGLTFPMDRPDLAAKLLQRSFTPEFACTLRSSALLDVRRRRADAGSMGRMYLHLIRSLLPDFPARPRDQS